MNTQSTSEDGTGSQLPSSRRFRPAKRLVRLRRGNRTGAYLTEFAFCVPIMFMVCFGSIELARFIYIRQAIHQTAYEAARQGILRGGQVADVSARANELLQAYGIVNAAVQIVPDEITEQTSEVTVSITCSFAENSWIARDFVSADEIETTITLDHENQAFLVPAGATDAEDLNENDEPLDV